MTLKKRTDVKIWEVEGEGVVYDPATGMGHVLNATALQIWALCDGRHTPADIEQELTKSYPDRPEIISRDVSLTIKQLLELGLLEPPL